MTIDKGYGFGQQTNIIIRTPNFRQACRIQDWALFLGGNINVVVSEDMGMFICIVTN